MSSARPATFFLPAIQRALAPDLLREPWRSQVCAGAHPHTGHCYVAAEALWHSLGGKAAGYTPMFIRHEGQPHWFLRGPGGEILDPTADQFRTPVPYSSAVAKGFLTRAPSKRAQELRRRAGLGGLGAGAPVYKLDRNGNRGMSAYLNDDTKITRTILWVPPRSLQEDPLDAPRDAERLASVKAALRAGVPLPAILAYEGDLLVFDGHHRRKAAIQLSIEKVPVQILEYR